MEFNSLITELHVGVKIHDTYKTIDILKCNIGQFGGGWKNSCVAWKSIGFAYIRFANFTGLQMLYTLMLKLSCNSGPCHCRCFVNLFYMLWLRQDSLSTYRSYTLYLPLLINHLTQFHVENRNIIINKQSHNVMFVHL